MRLFNVSSLIANFSRVLANVVVILRVNIGEFTLCQEPY